MLDRFDIYDRAVLAGAALLAIGACLPVAYLPIVGSMTYINGGKGDGLFAIIICVLVFFKLRWIAGLIGLGIGALLLTTFVRLVGAVYNVSSVAQLPDDNPFASLVKSAVGNNVGLGVGWFPLFIGLFLVLGGSCASFFKARIVSETTSAPAPNFDPDAVVKKYLQEHGDAVHTPSQTSVRPAATAHPTKAFGRRAGAS